MQFESQKHEIYNLIEVRFIPLFSNQRQQILTSCCQGLHVYVIFNLLYGSLFGREWKRGSHVPNVHLVRRQRWEQKGEDGRRECVVSDIHYEWLSVARYLLFIRSNLFSRNGPPNFFFLTRKLLLLSHRCHPEPENLIRLWGEQRWKIVWYLLSWN